MPRLVYRRLLYLLRLFRSRASGFFVKCSQQEDFVVADCGWRLVVNLDVAAADRFTAVNLRRREPAV